MTENAKRSETVYDERIVVDAWTPPWIRHQHVGRYEWILPKIAGMRVADAACGSGYGSAMMSATASSVEGFDLAEDVVAAATARYGASNLTFTAADVCAIPRSDDYFDAFVSFETIEHMPSVDAYLHEIRRVLKPGGTFYCSTPNRLITNPGTSIDQKPYNPWHLFEFAPDELRAALQRVFDDVELFGQAFFGRTYATSLARIGRVLPSAAVRVHQMRKVASIPFDRAVRHMPRFLDPRFESEALVACCR